MVKNILSGTLLAAMLCGYNAGAQLPGGVPVSAWYRADGVNSLFSDAGTTPVANNAAVQQWNEAGGTGFNLVQTSAGSKPVFSNATALANFNPTVTFDGSNDWMQFTAGTGVNIIDRADGTLYAAGYVNVLKRNGFLGFHPSMDYPGLHLYANNNLLFFTGGPGYQGQSTAPMAAQSYFTAGTGWLNGAGTNSSYAAATVSLNGNRISYSASQLQNADLSTGARDLRIGADNNYGSFSGQLNEVMVFENRLTTGQMDQVETYLAIKYGTTYAGGTRDYKNAAGGTVWTAANNAGYITNIAGIARDNSGALHQKQSWSTNTGLQVLIGTTGLANTNAANTTGLTDGQYLVWGDNGLARTPSVALTGVTGLSHRFATIWKVQNSGSVGTVRIAWVKNLANLSLMQSSDNVFNASDVVTNMSANEITVNGVVYNYADVTLADGQYFTFACKVAAPGGVSGPAVWLKADAGTTLSGASVSGWVNYGNSGGVAGQLTNSGTTKWALPKFGTNEHNFNPAIVDDVAGSNDGSLLLADVFPSPAHRPLSSFILQSTSNVASANNMISFTPLKQTSGALEAPYLAGYTAGRLWFYWQGPYETAPTLPNSVVRTNNIPSVNAFYVPQWVSGTQHQITVGLNGATAAGPLVSTAATSYPYGNQLFIFGDGNANNTSGGKTSEIITYDRDLTLIEKQQVNSYLAIKYGITLTNTAGTTVANYLNSNGIIVWDTTVNSGYNKNIAGIANDQESTLNQKQSRSVNAGSQLIIGTTGLANTNALNANSLSNGQYLIWGDNGLTRSLSVPLNGVASVNLRFAAIWKVQNTGTAGTVRVTWPTGVPSITLVQSADAVFDASDTRTDMSANTQVINGVTYNYADVTLANGQYFTFAGFIAGPGGVATDLSLWYKADNGVETDASKKVTGWNNSTPNDVKLTMSGTSSYIPYNDQTTYKKTWNFNPTLSFDGTNNYLSNITTNYLQTTGSVHYIAVARLNAAASSYNSIFAITGNDDGFFLYPSGGLVYPMPAIGNGFGAAAAGPGAVTRYGIYSAILPRTGSPANQRGFYNGLQKIYTSPYPLTGGSYSLSATGTNNANIGAFIGADGSTGDNPNGDIAEVILYNGPANNDMANTELAKVHSYLAIKYGITLDQTAAQNYVNSAGSVVWDATANTGFNSNIAGIAKDTKGALNQKQSRSVNAGNQVVISTTGLASTNAANALALADNQFLIWGDNNLLKAPQVSIAGVSGVNYRFASIWKAQNIGSVGAVRVAWPKGYKNLKLIQSADTIFNASDVITDMTNTQVVNGTEYAYADVTLTNGQYFTFAAQLNGPGGVALNLRVWLRSDAGFAEDNWTDFSGNANDYTQTNETRQPFVANKQFNFNPIVDFGGNGADARFMVVPSGKPYTANGLSSTIFIANTSRVAGGFSDIYGFGATTTTSSLINANNPVFTKSGNNNQLYPYGSPGLPAIELNRLYLDDVSHTTGSAGVKYAQNGQRDSIASTVSAGNAQYANGSVLGSQPEERNGQIGEVVAYERDLSEAEKKRVRSYVAIKYGITLPHNYVASDGTTIFRDSIINYGFNKNIAGIVRDDNGSLNQKQSWSINSTREVLISTTGLAASNATNGTQLADQQFLTWGDNNLTKSPTVAIAGVSGVNYRFAAIWKAQNTGSVGTVRVAWKKGYNNLKLIQSADTVFNGSDVITDMNNSITIGGVDYSYADVTLSNGQYFTFASQLNGPGGVGLDLRVWLRSDAGFDPETWTDFSSYANDYTQTNDSRQPFLASRKYNFNPIVNFGTTGTDARFMAIPSGKPYSANGKSSTIFTATLSNGASGYTDIIGFGATTTTATLTDASNPAFTKQNNNVLLYPYSAPALPAVTLNRLYLDDVSHTTGTAGIKYGQNGQTATVAQTFTAGNALYANGSILGSQPEVRNGMIGEVIAYERDLNEAEKQRVRSYVAIKYGLTLPHNYVASNGTTIFWDSTINRGFGNNIAGIVRDDNGALNQKQSWSINSSKEVLISTTGMAADNAGNATSLADQQFLTWGDNNLAKSPAVPVPGIAGVNSRFAAIWKVQNTGTVGTVRVAWPKGFLSLKLIQSADTIFNGSDVITDMASSQTLDSVEYTYADVTLSNGQYFTFAANLQAPGGVISNLSYWYRADKNVEAAAVGSDVTGWTDFTSGIVSRQLGANALPVLAQGTSTYFNYNPGINYTTVNQSLGNLSVRTFNNTAYDVFTLTKDGIAGGGNGRVFSSLLDNTLQSGSINYWDGFGDMADNRTERLNTAQSYRYLATIGGTRVTTQPSIVYHNLLDTTTGKAINGAAVATSTKHNSIGALDGGHAFGSTQFSGNGSDNAGFTGGLGEVIVYGNGNITATERNKVESYLAIKYGITLNNANNYTTSQGTVVWDATANAAFYNNVAGIGTDLTSSLEQKQSRSQLTNTNNQVIMGLGDIAETNTVNANTLSDGKFLVWGDNGNTTAMTATAGSYKLLNYAGSTNSRRMNRVWKVQNTSVADQMKIRFPKASVGTTTLTTGDACGTYAIIYASDTGFTSNVTVVKLDTTEDGVNYETMNAFPAGASYFTFGKVTPLNNGVVYLPPVVENTTVYNTNCNVGEWVHYTKTGNTTLKMLGLAGYTTPELNNFAVTITPEGISYDDGTRTSRLMARITTVANNNAGAVSTGKVRVYYSQDEMNAAILPGASSNGWYRYKGDADSVLEDIYKDGLFLGSRTTALTPVASGIENGVNYVEFQNINSFGSFVFLSSSEVTPLPVNSLEFIARGQNGKALLDWTTLSDHTSAGFDIERSADGVAWGKIGSVAGKAANGGTKNEYAYTDEQPLAGNNHYRLKQLEPDGRYEYSAVRRLMFGSKSDAVTIAPNPVTGIMVVSGLSGNSVITITNSLGQTMMHSTADGSLFTTDMSSYKAGIYFINIRHGNGSISSHKVIKE